MQEKGGSLKTWKHSSIESVKKTDIYLLHRCLLRDDRLRWSSTQLLDHSFLKEPVPALLPPPDKEEPEQKKDGELSI